MADFSLLESPLPETEFQDLSPTACVGISPSPVSLPCKPARPSSMNLDWPTIPEALKPWLTHSTDFKIFWGKSQPLCFSSL